MQGWVVLLLIRNGFGLLLDHPSGLNLFYVPPLFCLSDDGRRDLVCWKDGPRGIFSIHCAWNSICLVLDKVEWWEFVWHKHVIPRFSFILWITIRGVLYSIISLGPIVLFRLSDAFYVEVIRNILITYFFIAHSLITFGMIYAPNVSSPFVVAFGLAPSWLSNLSVLFSFCAYEIDVSFCHLLYLEGKECSSLWWCSLY